MAMRFGWWRASWTRIDFGVPVIEPPIGIALASLKDEAVRIQSDEVYERYMKYLTGCAKMFRVGYIDVNQFTLAK